MIVVIDLRGTLENQYMKTLVPVCKLHSCTSKLRAEQEFRGHILGLSDDLTYNIPHPFLFFPDISEVQISVHVYFSVKNFRIKP